MKNSDARSETPVATAPRAGLLALPVDQWLDEWDSVPTDATKFQSPPPRRFYILSMSAAMLKSLSDTHARKANVDQSGHTNTSVQRGLERDRSLEISRYVRDGYPLSAIGSRKMSPAERASLRKPGWLPTAIIANIVPAEDSRAGVVLAPGDAMAVSDAGSGIATLELPASWRPDGWKPDGAFPLEIIDGQHRLSAFDDESDDDFQLPVVVFEGLDFSWQAYLFWTINIKPKKINASLAFDLYPLLREQDWLEAGESLAVYRETRAQELVEALWADPDCVWYDRINMLGETGMKAQRPVTQAAFVRSLTYTMVRPFKGNKGLGGLFGGSPENEGLGWPRGQQAAFLAYAWNQLAFAVLVDDTSGWSRSLRETDSDFAAAGDNVRMRQDPAFTGSHSLLASDQGVRGFHMVLNDVCYLGLDEIGLSSWHVDADGSSKIESGYELALGELDVNPVGDFLKRLASSAASFDWRNSKALDLTDQERDSKRALRGSGGYNVLRERVLRHLVGSPDAQVARLAREALAKHEPAGG